MSGRTLQHPGTGRPCVILPTAKLAEAPPLSGSGSKYVLVIVGAGDGVGLSVAHARAWLDVGAAYICAWGPGVSAVEEGFDYASFLPELGVPLPYTLLTTSHERESLSEALWFAFWSSAPPEDLASDLDLVVILPESDTLAQQVRSWVETNVA